MNDKIWKVARIISDREIAINVGSDQGLGEGDVLLVLDEPIVIEDPDTGSKIGEIVRHKAVVKVYAVEPSMALARTFRIRTINIGGTQVGLGGLASIMSPPKYVTETETLRRDPDKDRSLKPGDSIVKAGDRVELYAGDPDDIPSSTVWR